MPQIWMTYSEVADMLGCTADEARDRAIADGLDRKLSRDGQKRVKLDLALTGIFLDRIRGHGVELDRAIEGMRAIHGRMLAYQPDPDLFDVSAGEKKPAAA